MNAALEKQPQTTADMMRRMFEIRAEKEALAEREKALNAEWEQLDFILRTAMMEQGSTRVATPQGTAILTEQVLPNVVDWDAFIAWAKENDALHMIQRRVSSPAYREFLDAGQEVPGLAPFTKQSINLRAASK